MVVMSYHFDERWAKTKNSGRTRRFGDPRNFQLHLVVVNRTFMLHIIKHRHVNSWNTSRRIINAGTL